MKLKVLILCIVSCGLLGCAPGELWRALNREQPQGTLVAALGMPLDEVRQRSTLKLNKEFYANLEWMKDSNPRDRTVASNPGDALFDLEIFGAGLRFEKCAYYWLKTGEHDDPRLVFMSIGLSPRKLTWPEVEAEMRETQAKFRKDGWTPLHPTGPAPQDPAHPTAPGQLSIAETGGFQWVKGEALANFYAKEHEVRTSFEKPVKGPNYFQVMEIKLKK